MFFQGFCTAVLITLQFANGAPLQDEKINPVDLASHCAVTFNDTLEPPWRSGVILIHGLGSSNDDWEKSLSVLPWETERKVCAPDLRNHGTSPWDNEQYDVKAMVADIEHYADSQDFEKVNLIGHSLGGKIAMDFALKYPDRVNSLIVEDMKPTNPTQEEVDGLLKMMLLMRKAITLVPEGSDEDDAKDFIVDYINKILKEEGITDMLLDENSKQNILLQCNEKECHYLMNIDTLIAGVENFDAFFGESKGLYEGPTMFIYGKESPIHVDKDKSNILRLFPNATLVGIEGAGHQIHGIHREFHDQVIRFLNALDS